MGRDNSFHLTSLNCRCAPPRKSVCKWAKTAAGVGGIGGKCPREGAAPDTRTQQPFPPHPTTTPSPPPSVSTRDAQCFLVGGRVALWASPGWSQGTWASLATYSRCGPGPQLLFCKRGLEDKPRPQGNCEE